eukprot:TRINITY_DN2253_c1_g1_i1.p1 TRINITY_DN2253_c1_g1~~TRINITY_DN2253_c1_g1_i1.p1  ORF type:complete len:483 (+),score=48.82 TRINITY_DN2253_c1_g1_i1:79-1527(+)
MPAPAAITLAHHPRWGALFVAVAATGFAATLYAAWYYVPRGANGAPRVVAAAFPMFAALMLFEAALTRLTRFPHAAAQYDWRDTWASVAAGLAQQAVLTVLQVSVVHGAVYEYVYDSIGSTLMPQGVYDAWSPAAMFVWALLVYDHSYYWKHRHCHTIGVLWAGHSVHHASDHYNLSTGLRQSWWQGAVGWAWGLPSAVLGIPPATHAAAAQVATVYQFWVHTCHVRRLGWLEYILSTPSAHRVHHDRRVHKNFGGVLIVWDILYGTFGDEGYDTGFLADAAGTPPPRAVELADETCYFGTAAPPPQWKDAVLQLGAWRMLWAARDVLRGPGWMACRIPRVFPTSSCVPRLRYTGTTPGAAALCYGATHAALAVACVAGRSPRYAVHALIALAAHGSLLDYAAPSRWVMETARLATIVAAFGAPWDPTSPPLDRALVAAALASLPCAVAAAAVGLRSPGDRRAMPSLGARAMCCVHSRQARA